MQRVTRSSILLSFLCFWLASGDTIYPQSGGAFQITQSVIAGGGSEATGPNFSLVGTVGQSNTAESNSGLTFTLRGGFWSASFAPTAAGVSISGRIRSASGNGIKGARLTLIQISTGETVSTISSSFGYYRFDDVVVGRLYLLSADAKQFVFDPNSRIISPLDEVTNEDFVGNPQ